MGSEPVNLKNETQRHESEGKVTGFIRVAESKQAELPREGSLGAAAVWGFMWTSMAEGAAPTRSWPGTRCPLLFMRSLAHSSY